MRAILAGSGVSTPSYYLNLSSPSNVTIADGQANGTITSTYNAVITASMSPSRITGVAPLYVNFDMTGTTSTDSTNPTHECFFATDFGDSGAGTWANGVQSAGLTSKNAGYGPVTGHVYETPGTYHPSMTVLDGNGNLVTKTGTVVVDDPDVVYAGTATICISHSGNFTGAPAGAEQYTTPGSSTDMYASFTAKKASNKRLLFCKADAWTCSAQMSMTSITGMTVGGYGTGVARAFGSGTLVDVNATAVSGSVFATYTGCSDIRICDMKVLGSSISLGLSLNNGIAQMTAYKLEFRGVTGGFNAYPGGGGTNNEFDQHCMYECVVDDLYGYAFSNPPTASASGAIGTPGVFTATAHPFAVGYKVRLVGTPPAPLATLTDYFISTTSFAANTFTLSSSLANANAGVSLALSGTGTCTVDAQTLSGGISAFVGVVRGGVMGCYLDSCNNGEQTLRIPFIDRGHINNNYIARPNQAKNSLKIHSFNYTEVALYSEKFVVSANEIDLRGGYEYGSVVAGATITQTGYNAITIGNGGSSNNERVRNGIVENNVSIACLGQPKVAEFANVSCPNMTFRNNIADFAMGDRTTAYTPTYNYNPTGASGFPASGVGVHMLTINTGGTIEDPVGIRVYNNSLYCNIDAMGECGFVQQNGAGASDIQVQNNLWYHPFVTAQNSNRSSFVNVGGATSVTVTNNTNDTTLKDKTSPNWVAIPPVTLTDWRPNTGSYAIDTGTTVPVLLDFNNSTRVGGTYDMGAVLP